MKPSRKQAELFINLLTGSKKTKCTFQTFVDKKAETREEAKKNNREAQVFHGTLQSQWKNLCAKQTQGHGIYITINETDFKGRKSTNIVSLRASFADFDDTEMKESKATPSILVRSKNGPHAYWLLDDGEPLEIFPFLQKTIAGFFGSDSSVSDLSRVMRLPGFYHLKDPDNPFPVKIESFEISEKHKIVDLLQVFAPEESQS